MANWRQLWSSDLQLTGFQFLTCSLSSDSQPVIDEPWGKRKESKPILGCALNYIYVIARGNSYHQGDVISLKERQGAVPAGEPRLCLQNRFQVFSFISQGNQTAGLIICVKKHLAKNIGVSGEKIQHWGPVHRWFTCFASLLHIMTHFSQIYLKD